MSRRRSEVDDDDNLNEDDDDDDDDNEEDRNNKGRPKKRKRTDKARSFIDDAAEESGEEGDGDDDDEDDDDDNNDYVKDGFVVDEDEDEKMKKKDDLEDSDDDDDDEEDDDEGEGGGDDDDEAVDSKAAAKTGRRLKKVRKLRAMDRLDEEDLALIQEAQQGDRPRDRRVEPEPRERVVARTEDELRRGLFADDDDDNISDHGDNRAKDRRQQERPERYDEYDDGFIEDDIGDQGDIMASERRGGLYDDEEAREVSEAQLNEASEIFGTDYLEFMADDQGDHDDEDMMGKYKGRGVGVDYKLDSEEDISDDDDDDLFDDDDDDDLDGKSSEQKKEALRLKREKRRLEKAERKREAMIRKAERRKALLRKAFEPVQLVENFCTERDDEIRKADAPERFFDWKTPFYGSDVEGCNQREATQAAWIAKRIHRIAVEYASSSNDEQMRSKILSSIANALRFMHRDKLEPAFLKMYRKDYIPSRAVRDSLHDIMDEEMEWDNLMSARTKAEAVFEEITAQAQVDESQMADEVTIRKLHDDFEAAQESLNDTANQETQIKHELEALGAADDDDDELFGDNDDEEEKKKERSRLHSHLSTVQELLKARAEKLSELQQKINLIEAQRRSLGDTGSIERIEKKLCRSCLWNAADYKGYLSTLDDPQDLADMTRYLNLIKEGNDAIRKKEMPSLEIKDGNGESRKRSRRFDRDFYRTCVSEGLRSVCYQFLLAPYRVGIKLEDTVKTGRFDFSKQIGSEDGNSVDPLRWVAPAIPDQSPDQFASNLIGSGELVLLSAARGGEAESTEVNDPLRGCRYVAATELAHEPRIRRVLREIYRQHALLTTRPTKKGFDNIDAFHDFYGIHLINAKPIKEHFFTAESSTDSRKFGMTNVEYKEYELEMRERVKVSCLQYLNVLKAEQAGDITIQVHLKMKEVRDDWYKMEKQELINRESQDLSVLMTELEKVYLPLDADVDKFSEERLKVLRLALTSILLPHFEAETRRDLRDAAIKVGVAAAAESLRTIAMEGPYRPAAIMHTENRFLNPARNLPLVGVCCTTDAKDATYLASTAEHGELHDFLAIPSGVRMDSHKMREKIITFLIHARPAAVVVGTSAGFESRSFQRKMVDLVKEAVERWNKRDIQGDDEDDETFLARRDTFRHMQLAGQDDEEEEWTCNVELIDDNVSQLFGRSVRSKKEFPDHGINLRCAVSLARYARDPLSELSYVWSVASDAGVFGTEMLFLNIHPMQQLLPKSYLLREYERVLCDVVSEVGVDFNRSCTLDHLTGLLTFVPGLGPRKAANLKQTVVQMGGVVARRRDLIEKRLLGPNVYNNAVAFLKICEVDQLDHLPHPLDETRLHPDVYMRNNWALKIAFDALEREDPKSKEAAAIKAVRDVMENSHAEVRRLFKATEAEWKKHYGPTFNIKEWDPLVNVPSDQWRDKVEELDLDTFANMIEQGGNGRWHSHLEMIKWEFRLPFADPRKPMEPLSGDKLFHLITGETDQSLRPGKEVTGKVVRNGDFGSRIKLEGDIPAFIPLRDLADEHVESADDILAVNTIVTAIVKEVKKDHMTVDLSLRLEDFRKIPSSWERPKSLPSLDDHFDRTAAGKIEEDNNRKREARVEALLRAMGARSGDDAADDGRKSRGRVVRRACTHPAFRNAKNSEVEKEIREGGASMIGEALIRPSSKTSDSLAIHWIIREGHVKVIEVVEEDKETEASIGNTLKVKGETYGSIDELLGRYIAPMNDYVEELVNHRKFIDVPEEDIDRKLTEQKKAQPQSIPYALCWMEMHPGYASLRFLTSSTPRNHPIGIGPKGFSWGVKTYSNLDLLLNDFKKNPKGAPAKPKDRGAGPREQPDRTDRPVAPTISRWGEKPVTTTTLPPPPQSGWGRPPPPPAPPGVPAMGGGWGKPVPPAAPAAPQTAPTAAWGRPAGPHATLPPQGGGAWGKPVAPAVLQPPPVAAGSWGKPAAPSVPLPPPTAVGNWGKPAPPPVPPQPPSAVGNWGKPPAPSGPPSLPEGGGGGGGGGWGTAVVAQRNGDGLGGWSQQAIARPPPPPPPPSLPPPPSSRTVPPQPPPSVHPVPTLPSQHDPSGSLGGFGAPAHPGADFSGAADGQGRGRGRGRTLPAWMSKS